jgi:sigma-E factor negative regulatory protein RseA
MKEQLSALIDSEFDLNNADHLIVTAKSNGELAKAWRNYHLIGDVMRDEAVNSVSLSQRIMAAIEEEPVVIAPAITQDIKKQESEKQAKQGQPVLWSVAASAAAVLFVGVMLFQNQSGTNADLAPIEMADNQTSEYLAAHQAYAPSRASYYIQNASYEEQ